MEGNARLEGIRWRDGESGEIETSDIGHLFIMTGAIPNTAWLNGCVVLDDKGFVKAGPDLSPDELAAAKWPGSGMMIEGSEGTTEEEETWQRRLRPRRS